VQALRAVQITGQLLDQGEVTPGCGAGIPSVQPIAECQGSPVQTLRCRDVFQQQKAVAIQDQKRGPFVVQSPHLQTHIKVIYRLGVFTHPVTGNGFIEEALQSGVLSLGQSVQVVYHPRGDSLRFLEHHHGLLRRRRRQITPDQVDGYQPNQHPAHNGQGDARFPSQKLGLFSPFITLGHISYSFCLAIAVSRLIAEATCRLGPRNPDHRDKGQGAGRLQTRSVIPPPFSSTRSAC
jgi:hypothetical protein